MFTTRPEIRGTFGMVSSTHYLATMAGWSMLERGGNAFDAAVAAGLALQVVHPYQNGPGGDLPIILHDATSGSTKVICGQGVAPQNATIDNFHNLGLDVIPGTGLLAACVPGAFGAWMLLLRNYGVLSLEDVMQPAIDYAQKGYAVVPMMHSIIENVAELFRSSWPSSANTYLVNGKPPKVGSFHKNQILSDTFSKILIESKNKGSNREAVIDAAIKTFYEGFVAEEIDRFCRDTEWLDSSGKIHGGLLNGQDMADWRPSIEPASTYEYEGFQVCKPGPWSQGPVFLQKLALLKGFDLSSMNPVGPEFIHTQIECAKLALADREAWYGDPKVNNVPLNTLLTEKYNDERRKLITDKASMEFTPGEPDGLRPKFADFQIKDLNSNLPAGTGEPNTSESKNKVIESSENQSSAGLSDGDTVHLDAVDQQGNMVACMPSGGWLQSSPVIPNLGFCLGTRAQMFWLQPGFFSPLSPGIRPRTTLSPTLVLKDEAAILAFGSPGGDAQDQWALSMFLRHIHHNMNLQEAIDAPNFHTDHLPSSFYPRTFQPGAVKVENRLPDKTIEELKKRGHRVESTDGWSLGRMTAVAREKTDNGWILKGAAHPRFKEAYAVGR